MELEPGILQRCLSCGLELPQGLALCPVCGAQVEQRSAMQTAQRQPAVFDLLESGEIGFEGPSDNSSIWSDEEQTGRTRAREIRAIARLQQALELTGVSEVGRGLARVFARRVENVDITQKKISPFEAFIYSLIEGQQTVPEIMESSGLTLYEAVTALNALYEQGIIIVEEIPVSTQVKALLDDSSLPDRKDLAQGQTRRRVDGRDELVSIGRVSLRQKVAKSEKSQKKPWVETGPDILFSLAEQAFTHGEVNRARDLVRQALVQAPNSERAQLLRERLQAPDQALERAKVLHGLGVRAYKDKDFNLAVRLIQASIEEYELNPSAHHRLGLALVHQRAPLKRAEKHLRRALDLDPGNPKYQRNLDRLLESSRRLRSQGVVG